MKDSELPPESNIIEGSELSPENVVPTQPEPKRESRVPLHLEPQREKKVPTHPDPQKEKGVKTNYLWQQKPFQAFKNFALIFSFVVNFILLIVLLLALPYILPAVNDAAIPIVGGLSESFVEMNEASITRTIEVNDTVPIDLDIQISTDTVVTLTRDVPLINYPITMNFAGGAGQINGTVTMILPTGLAMPVHLNMGVPVSDQIPVNLLVDVNIPLAETQLVTPFTRLENIFQPIVTELEKLPEDNDAALQLVLPE